MPQTSQSFKNFARLPKEIRLKIWQFSIPVRRVIKLEWDGKRKIWRRGNSIQGWRVHCSIIPSLGVNWESREETLKHYQKTDILPLLSERIGRHYFNFDRDILVFGGEDGYQTMREWVHAYLFPVDNEITERVRACQAIFLEFCGKVQNLAIAPPRRLKHDMSIRSSLTASLVFTGLKKFYTPTYGFKYPWNSTIYLVEARDEDLTYGRVREDWRWAHQRMAERIAEETERLARCREQVDNIKKLLIAMDRVLDDAEWRFHGRPVEHINLVKPIEPRNIDLELVELTKMEPMGFGNIGKRYRYPNEITSGMLLLEELYHGELDFEYVWWSPF